MLINNGVIVLIGCCLTVFPTAFASVFIRKEVLPCDFTDREEESPTLNNIHRSNGDCKDEVLLSVKLVQDVEVPNKHQLILVDSLFDVNAQEEVRLIKPLVVKIYQQPATIAYPFKYLFSANNRPYEVIINKRISSTYHGCDPYAEYQPACQMYEQPNQGNGKTTTQGFCCPCEPSQNKNPRGNLVCPDGGMGEVKDKNDINGTVHCLRFDPVWYSVNVLKEPIFHHRVNIAVFILNETAEGEKSWDILTKSPFMTLGTHHRKHTHGYISASYTEITQLPAGKDLPLDHEQQMILVPQPHISSKDHVLPQTREGPKQFLIVNKTMVDQTGETCNKIGVSYSAFEKQRNRCQSPLSSCLQNSIEDIWLQDLKRVISGQQPRHFAAGFGNLSNPAVVEEHNESPLLLYDTSFEHISHVYIRVSTDIIQTSTQIQAEIVEGISISDGITTQIEILVHNRALVTTAFRTDIMDCNDAKLDQPQPKAVGPYASGTFLLTLQHSPPNLMPKNVSSCTVLLLNHKGLKVAERKISLDPMHRCFCVGNCACKCTSEPNWEQCEELKRREFEAAGIDQPVSSSKNTAVNPWAVFEFILLIILCLLLLGCFKHLIEIIKEYWDYRNENGPKPSWNAEHRCQRACLDIWYFFYCPCLLCKQCVCMLILMCPCAKPSKSRSSDLTDRSSTDVFRHTKEDTGGKFMLSDSEGEEERPSFSAQLEREASLRSGKSTASQSSSLRNQNQQNNMLVGTEYRPPSPDKDGVPVKKSSSSSLMSRQALELSFRKQKEYLLDVLKKKKEPDAETQRLIEQTYLYGGLPDYEKSPHLELEPMDKASLSLDGRHYSTDTLAEEESLTQDEIETLNVLTTPNTPVFYNYTSPTSRLRKTGNTYSLCGNMRKSGMYYKWSLGPYNTQLFWNKDGQVKKLLTPLPIDSKHFLHVLTSTQVLSAVTLEPVYPCLNYI